MTKQELDEAYVAGKLNQENYKIAMQKLGSPPEIGEAQKTVDAAMQSLVQASQQTNPAQKRYQELLASNQIQNPEKPMQEIDQLAVQTLEQETNEAKLKKEADLEKQNEVLAKAQEEQKKIDDFNQKKKSLGIEVNQDARQPAQDGEKSLNLLDNPASKNKDQDITDLDKTNDNDKIDNDKLKNLLNITGVSSNLGQVQAAYSNVGRVEKEFDSLMQEQKLEDQRRQQSAYEAEQFYKGKLAEADAYNKEFENSSQIDPGRYWAKADTWSKIGAVLASAFSGYAQAYTGGRNVGLDMIKDMIDKDVDAQVKNASLLQQKAQSAMNMYQTYRQIFKDDQMAYDATKLSKLNLVKAKYDMAQGKFKSAADMAKLDTDIQGLNLKMQEELLKNGSFLTQAIDITNDKKSRFDNDLNKDPAILKQKIKDGKVEAININGSRFVAENADVQKNIRTLYTATNQVNGILDKLANVQKGGVTDQVSRDRFTSLMAQLTPLTTKKYGLGSLDEGLQNLVKNLTSGITYDAIRSDPQKAILSYKRDVNSEFENFANSVFSGETDYISQMGTNPALEARAKKRP